MKTTLKSILEEKGPVVHTTTPEATVLEAVRAMNDRCIGSLLVTDGGRVVGIFTERDVLRRVVDAGRDPKTTKVAEVMSREMVAIHPEATVEETMAVMTEKRVRHLPVMRGEELLGMVSIGDLTRWVSRLQQHHIKDLVDYITGRYPA